MTNGYTDTELCFEWDEAKNQANIAKHGVDFNDISAMFDQPMLVTLDDRVLYEQPRWIGIGRLINLHAVVVYIEPTENAIRIISARKANATEIRRYEKIFRD